IGPNANVDGPGDGVFELNVLDPAFRADSATVAAARTADWYARTPIGVAVLGHCLATALLADRRVRCGGVELSAARGITSGSAVIFSASAAAHLNPIDPALATPNDATADLIEQRRVTPGADPLTDPIAADEAGARLSPIELRTMPSALLFDGQDTTRQQLGL